MNKKKNLVEVLKGDAVVMSARDIMTTSLEEMNTTEVHCGWSILDLLEKAAKDRKAEMRSRLLKDIDILGMDDDRGNSWIVLKNGSVKKEVRRSKPRPNEAAVRALLRERGVDSARAFTTRVVEELNLDSLKDLVAKGVISQAELDGVMEHAKETFALKVVKPDYLPKLLKGD
jgi:hypothetical protein